MMTKVTFLLFCYFFEKIVSEYLHVILRKYILNLFFIIVIKFFFPIDSFIFVMEN